MFSLAALKKSIPELSEGDILVQASDGCVGRELHRSTDNREKRCF